MYLKMNWLIIFRPQFPERLWTGFGDQDTNRSHLGEEDQQVLSFLDSAETRFGPKSVLYIRQGLFSFSYSIALNLPKLRVIVLSLGTPRSSRGACSVSSDH